MLNIMSPVWFLDKTIDFVDVIRQVACLLVNPIWVNNFNGPSFSKHR